MWGQRYIDDLVLRDRDANGDGPLDERLYACQDANWNTVVLINASATALERYLYSPFGWPAFLGGDMGTVRTTSAVDNDVLFTGQRFDVQTHLHLFRKRWLDAISGRFITRDPLKYPDGPNAYAGWFVPKHSDPQGLRLQNEYSRSGDDPGENYETARIIVTVRRVGTCEKCPCRGFATLKLDYIAAIRGRYASSGYGVGAGFGLIDEYGETSTFERLYTRKTAQDFGLLETTMTLGRVPCTGGAIQGALYVGGFSRDDSTASVIQSAQQRISYNVVVTNCGTLDGDVFIAHLPLIPEWIELGKVWHPLRCVSCGEPPYPLYEGQLND